jgi:signal transduction histidine kinase
MRDLTVRVAGRLPDLVELGAYYIVSEALANVAKHANAQVVIVCVEAGRGVLSLSVRDDGVGGADPDGSGLTGLRERAEALGGTLKLTSPPGRDTSADVRLPAAARRFRLAGSVAARQAPGYCHHVNAPGTSAGAPDGGVGRDPPDQARLGQLAEEQAALRRVATLVARATPPEAVFAAVAEEVGQLLPVDSATMCRYESDGTLTFVAHWGLAVARFPVGTRRTLGGHNLGTLVFESGRSARVDGYADSSSGALGVVVREAALRSAVGTPIIVDGRLWGLIAAGSSLEQPLPLDTETRLASFTELVATAVANAESRAALAGLAEEQAALRRVATLVARATPPEAVFAAVAEEVGRFLAVDFAILVRYDPQDMLEVVGTWTRTGAPAPTPVGGRLPLGGRNVTTAVYQSGRPARIDYSDVSGVIGQVASHDWGLRSSVGVPVSAESRLWGCIVVAFSGQELRPLPADTESRLASFTELVATAIANAESHAALTRLAEEQAALRRVATLAAQGVPPVEIFSAVSDEVARLFGAQAGVLRFEPDDPAVVFVGVSKTLDLPVGTRWEFQPGMASAKVYRTGCSARVDAMDWSSASGPVAGAARRMGIVSSVASPIVVEGRLWGAMNVASTDEVLPFGLEGRLGKFTELLATAIANAESRSELAASRRRIVAASDEARRRIERDLHDGTQQRLVSLGLAARTAEADVAADRGELRAELSRIAAGLADAAAELQEFSRGIHPAILSAGGLGRALRALARRSAVPVDLDVTTNARYPEPIEMAAYYVASETLANTMKHAQASRIEILLTTRDGSLLLSIRDDGVGGADPAHGSGLAGLADRVEALGGSIHVHSAAGAGTHVTVDLPLEYELAQGAG